VVNPVSGAVLRTFLDPAPTQYSFYGGVVAVVGNNVAVGAPHQSSGRTVLYDGATGALLHTLSGPGNAGSSGDSLAVTGTSLVIGTLQGHVRLYDADPASPTFGNVLQTFTNPSATSNNQFGLAVATLGSNVLVSARYAADPYPGNVRAGAVY